MKTAHRSKRATVRLRCEQIEERIASIRRTLAGSSDNDEFGALMSMSCEFHNIAEVCRGAEEEIFQPTPPEQKE